MIERAVDVLPSDAMTVLGITAETPPVEVKERYRSLIKQNHPDVTGDPGDSLRLSRIVEAYRVLTINKQIRPDIGFTRKYRPVGKTRIRELVTLGRWALEAENAATRAYAVRKIGELHIAGGIAFLRQAVHDSDERVADEAVRALFSQRSLQIPRVCLELFPGLRSRQRKQMILRALSQRLRFADLIHAGAIDIDREIRDLVSHGGR